MVFLKGVLSGEKKLLKIQEAKAIPKIPKYGEIDVHKLWNEIKVDESVSVYFLDAYLQEKYVPDRTYFFTV